ncbi:unnamed protein product [Gordionus sp. m RMFG-2023]|uniref:uncharacterized protein LOC135927492 n=1 Tax=Gordionus sp. m RMFG-2023 TaxID=3053472 RepID=UPI0030E595EA
MASNDILACPTSLFEEEEPFTYSLSRNLSKSYPDLPYIKSANFDSTTLQPKSKFQVIEHAPIDLTLKPGLEFQFRQVGGAVRNYIEIDEINRLVDESQSLDQNDKDFVLVDLGSLAQYNSNHIKNAIHVPGPEILLRRLKSGKLCIKNFLYGHFLMPRASLPLNALKPRRHDSPKMSAAGTLKIKVIVYERSQTMNEEMVAPRKSKKLENGDNNMASKFFRELENGRAELSEPCPELRNVGVYWMKGTFDTFSSVYPNSCAKSPKSSHHNFQPSEAVSSDDTASGPALMDDREDANKGPTKILPYLYVGSLEDALNQSTLEKLGITYILNVSTSCPEPDFAKLNDKYKFMRVPINDNYDADMMAWLDESFAFIERAKNENEAVLIHCLAGISRSPSLTIAYIMKYLGMTSEQSYKYVKSKRVGISPNFNFMGQLLEYEKLLLKSPGKRLENSTSFTPGDATTVLKNYESNKTSAVNDTSKVGASLKRPNSLQIKPVPKKPSFLNLNLNASVRVTENNNAKSSLVSGAPKETRLVKDDTGVKRPSTLQLTSIPDPTGFNNPNAVIADLTNSPRNGGKNKKDSVQSPNKRLCSNFDNSPVTPATILGASILESPILVSPSTLLAGLTFSEDSYVYDNNLLNVNLFDDNGGLVVRDDCRNEMRGDGIIEMDICILPEESKIVSSHSSLSISNRKFKNESQIYKKIKKPRNLNLDTIVIPTFPQSYYLDQSYLNDTRSCYDLKNHIYPQHDPEKSPANMEMIKDSDDAATGIVKRPLTLNLKNRAKTPFALTPMSNHMINKNLESRQSNRGSPLTALKEWGSKFKAMAHRYKNPSKFSSPIVTTDIMNTPLSNCNHYGEVTESFKTPFTRFKYSILKSAPVTPSNPELPKGIILHSKHHASSENNKIMPKWANLFAKASKTSPKTNLHRSDYISKDKTTFPQDNCQNKTIKYLSNGLSINSIDKWRNVKDAFRLPHAKNKYPALEKRWVEMASGQSVKVPDSKSLTGRGKKNNYVKITFLDGDSRDRLSRLNKRFSHDLIASEKVDQKCLLSKNSETPGNALGHSYTLNDIDLLAGDNMEYIDEESQQNAQIPIPSSGSPVGINLSSNYNLLNSGLRAYLDV